MKRTLNSALLLALLLGLACELPAAETNAVVETNVAIGTPRAVHHSRRNSSEPDSTNFAPVTAIEVTNTTPVAVTNTPAAENAITGTDLTSFDIISRRNIFNPNRSGRRGRTSRSDRTAQVDSFTLVGTLSYVKGNFAIFDGTSSSYRKNLKAAETIAGYKVAGIYPDYVQLGAASNQFITLTVGSQMRRSDGGPWRMVARADVIGNSYASSSGNSSTSSSSRSSGERHSDSNNSNNNLSSGGESPSSASSEPRASGRPPLPTSSEIQSEIMKKLMQKRESEQ